MIFNCIRLKKDMSNAQVREEYSTIDLTWLTLGASRYNRKDLIIDQIFLEISVIMLIILK